MGKSKRVEGQESLHTVGGSADYQCLATCSMTQKDNDILGDEIF